MIKSLMLLSSLVVIATTSITQSAIADRRGFDSVIVQSVENNYNTFIFTVDFIKNGRIVEQRRLTSDQARNQISSMCPRVRFAPGALR